MQDVRTGISFRPAGSESRGRPVMNAAVAPGPAAESGASEAVLMVALDPTTDGRVREAMRDLNVSIQTALNSDVALSTLRSRSIRLVWCGYPLPHLLLRHFLQLVRNPVCESRRCGIIVVSIPELLSGATRFVGEGANAVVPRWAPVSALADAAQRLLKAPPRYPARHGTLVRVYSSTGDPIPVAAVANISASGLLLESDERPPLGSECVAEVSYTDLPDCLSLPSRVVRHTRPGRERHSGFALQFAAPPPELGHHLAAVISGAELLSG
jgi:PilZ domain